MKNILELTNSFGTATISFHGAQVLSYIPKGATEDLLWCTSLKQVETAIAEGRAIRGGIPICMPFGPHPQGLGPQHGYPRLRRWTLASTSNGRAELTLALDGADAGFPHKAQLRLEVAILREELEVTLTATNMGETAFPFTGALHTYLWVGDVAQTTLYGLEGASRQDLNGDRTTLGPSGEPLHLPATIDSLFFDGVCPEIRVKDPVLKRWLHVETGPEAVIWTPGEDKPDMAPPGSHRHMLCVEASRAHRPVMLARGFSHQLKTRLRAIPLEE